MINDANAAISGLERAFAWYQPSVVPAPLSKVVNHNRWPLRLVFCVSSACAWPHGSCRPPCTRTNCIGECCFWTWMACCTLSLRTMALLGLRCGHAACVSFACFAVHVGVAFGPPEQPGCRSTYVTLMTCHYGRLLEDHRWRDRSRCLTLRVARCCSRLCIAQVGQELWLWLWLLCKFGHAVFNPFLQELSWC